MVLGQPQKILHKKKRGELLSHHDDHKFLVLSEFNNPRNPQLLFSQIHTPPVDIWQNKSFGHVGSDLNNICQCPQPRVLV